MSKNDNIDWEDFLKSVKPLKNKRQQQFISKKLPLIDSTKNEFSQPDMDFSDLEILSEKKINKKEIDKNLLSKIIKRKIKINSVLDLHGCKVNESKTRVVNFIKNNYETNNRLILIITGKGKRLGVEDGWKGKGVLKEVIPQWLNSVLLSKFIIWFDFAPKNMGGEGAILVYLKKTIK